MVEDGGYIVRMGVGTRRGGEPRKDELRPRFVREGGQSLLFGGSVALRSTSLVVARALLQRSMRALSEGR